MTQYLQLNKKYQESQKLMKEKLEEKVPENLLGYEVYKYP